MRTRATAWALPCGASIGAHAALVTVLSLVLPPPDRAPRLAFPEGRASGVRVVLVSREPERPDAAPGAGGTSPEPVAEAVPDPVPPPVPDPEEAPMTPAAPPGPEAALAVAEPAGPEHGGEAGRPGPEAPPAPSAAVVIADGDPGPPIPEARIARDLRALASRLGAWARAQAAAPSPAAAPKPEPMAGRTAGADCGGGTPGVATAPVPSVGNRPPAYPVACRRRGETGTVRLRITVDVDGRVARVEVGTSSGHDLLDEAALAAARAWRFTPAQEGGAAVCCAIDLPVVFVLD